MHFLKTILTASAVALPISQATAQEHRFTLATMPVPGEAVPIAAERFAERLTEALGDRVSIVYNDSLLTGPELAPGVRDGRVEMAVATYPYLTSSEPRFGVTNLPGLVENADDYRKLMAEFLQAEFEPLWLEQANAVSLVDGLWTPVMLFTTSPIRTVEDFRGKKIRVSNVETGQFVTQLGASPVPIPPSEIGMGLERGVIDGFITSVCYSHRQGFFEFTGYMNEWGISPTTGWAVVINKDIWDGLPEDVQDTMLRVGDEVEKEMWAEFDALSEDCYRIAEEAGIEHVVATAEDRAAAFADSNTATIYEDWYRRAAEKGFDGEAFVRRAREILGR